MNESVLEKAVNWLKPRKPAWLPATYTTDDVIALKAVWAGEATPGQQRQALEWIIIHGGQYGEMSYRSDKDGGERETAFAQGRWFVAQQIQKLIGLDARLIAKLRREENAGRNPATAGTSNTSHATGTHFVDPDKHAKSGS